MNSKKVKIADLKANLSRHLRDVRGGRSLTVFDRDTPIATLSAYNQTSSDMIELRLPLASAPKLSALRSPLKAKATRYTTSSLDILNEHRGDK